MLFRSREHLELRRTRRTVRGRDRLVLHHRRTSNARHRTRRSFGCFNRAGRRQDGRRCVARFCFCFCFCFSVGVVEISCCRLCTGYAPDTTRAQRVEKFRWTLLHPVKKKCDPFPPIISYSVFFCIACISLFFSHSLLYARFYPPFFLPSNSFVRYKCLPIPHIIPYFFAPFRFILVPTFNHGLVFFFFSSVLHTRASHITWLPPLIRIYHHQPINISFPPTRDVRTYAPSIPVPLP